MWVRTRRVSGKNNHCEDGSKREGKTPKTIKERHPTGHRDPGWSQLYQCWKKNPNKKEKFKEGKHPLFSLQSQGFYASERAPDGRRQKSAVTFASLTSGSMCVFLVNMIKNTVNYMLILCWCLLYDPLYIAVYILHIYIQITVQSCIHKAMHTVLYGKFKSISEVIRTICDFPLLGCGREMNLEIGKGLPWRLGGSKQGARLALKTMGSC